MVGESERVTGYYDIELIDNVKFGQHHWDKLVEFMGDSGEFAILVGSLTVPLHNLWADEGLKYAQTKYPNLKLVTDRIPSAEGQELSRQKVLELIKAYPDLKGVIGFGSLGPPGAAQAVKEKGLTDKIAVVGTVIPSHAAPYLKDGSLKHGILWDPKDAGYAMVWLAKYLLDGQKAADGMEIPGMGKAVLEKNVLKFDKMIDITKGRRQLRVLELPGAKEPAPSTILRLRSGRGSGQALSLSKGPFVGIPRANPHTLLVQTSLPLSRSFPGQSSRTPAPTSKSQGSASTITGRLTPSAKGLR